MSIKTRKNRKNRKHGGWPSLFKRKPNTVTPAANNTKKRSWWSFSKKQNTTRSNMNVAPPINQNTILEEKISTTNDIINILENIQEIEPASELDRQLVETAQLVEEKLRQEEARALQVLQANQMPNTQYGGVENFSYYGPAYTKKPKRSIFSRISLKGFKGFYRRVKGLARGMLWSRSTSKAMKEDMLALLHGMLTLLVGVATL